MKDESNALRSVFASDRLYLSVSALHHSAFVPHPSLRAFGSDWAQLEAGMCGRGNLPFRDPLNQERRFIPLRLDDAPIKGSLAQFLYINWRPADREQEYAKLLEAGRPARPYLNGRKALRTFGGEEKDANHERGGSVNSTRDSRVDSRAP